MITPGKCPNCETNMPPDAPAGVCPRCLLQAGIRGSGEAAADDRTLITASQLNVDVSHGPDNPGRTPPSPESPPVGAILRYFGDYELLEEIARGGMGVVYRARQVRLNRQVALKMILAGQLAGTDDVHRFQSEAEAAARLDHPGIVPIFEVGEHKGHHYFSMGLIEGESLAHRLTHGPLAPATAAELIRKIAEAVQYAHDKGVIHRDLKPANILIDTDGAPRVTDFGLAKRVEGESHLTATGQVLGTPSYMPPEQAMGRMDQVNELSDVYSLGAVLYAALTGRPPFQSASLMDTLIQVTSEEPVGPRDLNRQVPQDLATITLKCLRKCPAHRYSSAAALGSDLSRWLRGEPILARPVGVLERSAKSVRRHPLVATLIVLIIASVVGGLLVSSRYAMLAQKEAVLAKERASEARDQRDKFQEQLWESLLLQSHAARLSGQRWQALDAVAEAARLKRDPRLRQAAIQTLAAPGVRLLHSFPVGQVESIVFSPDSGHLAIVGRYTAEGSEWNRSRVGVWDTSTGKKIAARDTVNFPFANRYRPESRELLIISEAHTFDLWNPATASSAAGRSHGLLSAEKSTYDDAALFSPDGEFIAIGLGGRLEVIHISTGERIAQRSHGTPLAFIGPDSLLLRLHLPPFGTVMWNYRSNEDMPRTGSQIQLNAISPEAAVAAFVDDGKLCIRNLATGETEASIAGEEMASVRAHFSPNGRLLAFRTGNDRNLIRIWDWRADLLTLPLAGVSGVYGDAFEEAVFNRDCSLLAVQCGNRTVKVWEVETGKLVHFERGASRPRFSPDGRFLAMSVYGTIDLGGGATASGPDKLVHLFEVASLSRTYTRHQSVAIESVSFSPDGQNLAAGRRWEVEQGAQGCTLWPVPTDSANAFEDTMYDASGQLWTVQQPVEEPVRRPQRLNQLNTITAAHEASSEAYHMEVEGRILAYDLSATHGLMAVAADVVREAGAQPFEGNMGTAVELWDLQKNRLRWREVHWRSDQVQCLSCSPAGDLVAIGRLNTGIEIVSASTGKRLFVHTFDNVSAANDPACLRFSTDGKHLFAADKTSGTMIAIDCTTGRTVGRWSGNEGGTLAVACLADGELIASGGRDGAIRLWSIRGNAELAKWETGVDQITALSFSPDGQTLVSASSEGTLQTWDLESIRAGLSSVGLHWE